MSPLSRWPANPFPRDAYQIVCLIEFSCCLLADFFLRRKYFIIACRGYWCFFMRCYVLHQLLPIPTLRAMLFIVWRKRTMSHSPQVIGLWKASQTMDFRTHIYFRWWFVSIVLKPTVHDTVHDKFIVSVRSSFFFFSFFSRFTIRLVSKFRRAM